MTFYSSAARSGLEAAATKLSVLACVRVRSEEQVLIIIVISAFIDKLNNKNIFTPLKDHEVLV